MGGATKPREIVPTVILALGRLAAPLPGHAQQAGTVPRLASAVAELELYAYR